MWLFSLCINNLICNEFVIILITKRSTLETKNVELTKTKVTAVIFCATKKVVTRNKTQLNTNINSAKLHWSS